MHRPRCDASVPRVETPRDERKSGKSQRDKATVPSSSVLGFFPTKRHAAKIRGLRRSNDLDAIISLTSLVTVSGIPFVAKRVFFQGTRTVFPRTRFPASAWGIDIFDDYIREGTRDRSHSDVSSSSKFEFTWIFVERVYIFWSCRWYEKYAITKLS